MKVCILGPITTERYYGGVAVFDEQLALGFSQAGHTARIVTCQRDAKRTSLFDVVPVYRISRKKAFAKWLETEKPDLVIGSLDHLRLMPGRRNGDLTVAYFLHGFFTRSYYGICKSHAAFFYQKWLMRRADLIFANSDFTGMIQREFFGVHVDKVFRLGVADDFLQKVKAGAGIRAKGTVLFTGRLVSAKGVGALLQAMKCLKAKGTDCKLKIAGDGPDRPRLEEYARENALNVVFLGKVAHENIAALYQEAEVFVSLNPSEPFGITFAEALLSGCKIVCPSTGGQVEFLCKWSSSVAFVRDASADAIANGIAQMLLEGQSPTLSEEERERFTYRFVAEQMADLVLHHGKGARK